MTTTKKKYRIEGIEETAIKDYAAKIAAAMNEMTDDGYNVQIIGQPHGALVFGTLQEPAPASPFMRLLSLGLPQGDKAETLSPRTRELFARFSQSVPAHIEPTRFPAEIGKLCSEGRLLSGFSAPELTQAADELEKDAEEHVATHSDPTCVYPEFARQIAVAVRAVARNALQ